MGDDLHKNGEEREDVKRPTPVRMAMDGGNEAEPVQNETTRVLHDAESGSDWSVNLTGWSASGVLPLRTVPLVELTFSRVEAPDEPVRKVLQQGESLAEFSDEDLLAAFRNSGPFRPPMRQAEASEKRGKGGRGRRGPQR